MQPRALLGVILVMAVSVIALKPAPSKTRPAPTPTPLENQVGELAGAQDAAAAGGRHLGNAVNRSRPSQLEVTKQGKGVSWRTTTYTPDGRVLETGGGGTGS